MSRFHCPLDDERLLKTPAVGLLPLVKNKDLTLVVAPRGTAARRLTGMIRNRPELARYVRFTTAERLNRFVLRNGAAAITAHASECLGRKRPDLSAANARSCWSVTLPAVLVLAGIAGPALAPSVITQIVALIVSVLFLAWLGLRVAVPIAAAPARGQQPDLPDNILPVYTIIVALYRQAASVSRLLSAIARLDYPAEKLDVILAIEADDKETRAAVTACNTRLPVSVVAVPAGGPRTKPKALNAALPFARGAFTVIYDAEDDPEPAQLRRSLQTFRRGGDALACLQASLCIDNPADGWLTRIFCRAVRPLPAGPCRVAAAAAPGRFVQLFPHRHLAAGQRLGRLQRHRGCRSRRAPRFGYRCGTINSTTYEEAPGCKPGAPTCSPRAGCSAISVRSGFSRSSSSSAAVCSLHLCTRCSWPASSSHV